MRRLRMRKIVIQLKGNFLPTSANEKNEERRVKWKSLSTNGGGDQTGVEDKRELCLFM